MKIRPTGTEYTPKFKSILTNKTLLKGLEFVSDHSTSFIAGTTLLLASGIRPLAIALTPKTDKENKKHLAVNAFTSGLVKFAMVEAVALPIENAVKKIDKNPQQFLNPDTINNLKGASDKLINSQNYKFASQFLKLSSGLITAIPKSALTIALMPFFMNLFFKQKKEPNKNKYQYMAPIAPTNNVFSPFFERNNSPSFKGNLTNNTAKALGKLLDIKTVQNLINKHSAKTDNIARNMSVATDILLTASFVRRTQKSKKIQPERKKPLIYNNIISTGLSILLGCSVDTLVKKNTKGFVEKFVQANKNNPKLSKYINGINIIRPTLIFAGIYYGILPVFSAYFADKTDKFFNNKHDKETIKR